MFLKIILVCEYGLACFTFQLGGILRMKNLRYWRFVMTIKLWNDFLMMHINVSNSWRISDGPLVAGLVSRHAECGKKSGLGRGLALG